MTRSLADLTPGERNAYVVFNQKLNDHTLSKEEHQRCREELDRLFHRGPFGQLELLKGELTDVKNRLTILEQYVLTDAQPIAAATATGTHIVADCGNQLDFKQTLSVGKQTLSPDSTTDETRGRPKLRFHPEKDANRAWRVTDRATGEFTGHGPYKTRKEAKDMADTLNNMPNHPPGPDERQLSAKTVYHDGDGVIRQVKPTVEVIEETADGGIIPEESPEDELNFGF